MKQNHNNNDLSAITRVARGWPAVLPQRPNFQQVVVGEVVQNVEERSSHLAYFRVAKSRSGSRFGHPDDFEFSPCPSFIGNGRLLFSIRLGLRSHRLGSIKPHGSQAFGAISAACRRPHRRTLIASLTISQVAEEQSFDLDPIHMLIESTLIMSKVVCDAGIVDSSAVSQESKQASRPVASRDLRQ